MGGHAQARDAGGAGAIVTGARLLGAVRSRCLSGPEEGLVLVRSIWRAEVTLLPWRPEYEIRFRRVVPTHELAGQLSVKRAPRRSTPVPPGKRRSRYAG